MRASLLMAAAVLVLLPACEKSGRNPEAAATVADRAADEQALRASISRWHELIRSRDAQAITLLFAEDGTVMAPGQPSASGREAILRFWQSAVEMPEMKLTFSPERIEFSQGGDIAIDRGTYRFQGKAGGRSLEETGKYVVIWKKVGKRWEVLTDIWNSNQPPAAA